MKIKITIFFILSFIFLYSTGYSVEDSLNVTILKTGITGGDIRDFDFASSNLGLAVGDDISFPENNFIAKTTDGGNTWVKINTTALTNRPYSVDFVNTTTAFVCGYSGMILKTTDAGNTWSALTSGVTSNLYRIKFYDNLKGYTCGASGVVLKTTDAGNTWASASPIGTNARYGIEFLSANEVIVTGTSSNTIRSTNDGATWNTLALTPSATLYDIRRAGENNLYIAASSQIIFKSTDRGVTFSVALDNGSAALYGCSFSDSLTGMFVGSNGINYKTTNGGLSYDSIPISNFTAQVCRSVICKSPTNFLVGADMGNIINTTNAGATWNISTTGSHFYGLDNSGSALVTVGYRGIVLKSADGLTYQDYKGINGFEAYDVKYFSANRFYVCSGSGRFYITTNGGTDFTERNLPNISSGATKTLWFFNENEGFAAGEMGGIYRTTDAGLTWTSVFSFGASFNNVEDIFFVNSTTGYACGEVGKFVKTTDGGLTWDSTGIDGPDTKTLWEMNFLDANTGFITSTNGCIYKTTNGAANWSLANDTIGLLNVDVIDINMSSATHGIAVGEKGKIFKLLSSGMFAVDKTILTNWGMEDDLWNINYINTNEAYVTGYNGTIYKIDIITPTSIGNNFENIKYELSQNYPNPFNPVTNINFSIPKSELVVLKIYDITGREIKTLINGVKNSGNYTITFDASTISSGIYFYKLTAGKFSSIKKMTLIK